MSLPRYPEYKDSGVAWLSAIPAHWEVLAARRIFNEYRDAALDDDEQLSATQRYGVIPQRLFMEVEDQKVVLALSGTGNFKHVQKDDFVISLRSFQGGIEWSGYTGCVSPAYTVLRSALRIEPKYWAYLFKCAPYISALQTVTAGIRDGKNISYSQFGGLEVPILPIQEQRAIATFLDRETAKIDALIAEQEKLIALLAEKRQATISHAVTKGLNPNAPMKDSGVEWLGEVPAHWEVKRFRDACCSISTGPFGTALGSDDYISGGVPVINPSHIVGSVIVKDDDISVSADTADRLSYWMLRAGDVVVARRGELGRAAVVGEASDGFICGTGSLRITPDRQRASAEMLHAVLQAEYAREWLNQSSVGSTMANLNEGILGDLPIALPLDVDEQDEIVASLSGKLSELEAVAMLAGKSITLLQERRSALIAAAVTGQIDVRGLAA